MEMKILCVVIEKIGTRCRLTASHISQAEVASVRDRFGKNKVSDVTRMIR